MRTRCASLCAGSRRSSRRGDLIRLPYHLAGEQGVARRQNHGQNLGVSRWERVCEGPLVCANGEVAHRRLGLEVVRRHVEREHSVDMQLAKRRIQCP